MQTRVYSINVPGPCGYSFAVKGMISTESDAINLASEEDLFDDPRDARYATAEDITGSQHDIDAFKDCTFEA